MPAAPHVLFVGSSEDERARVQRHLALPEFSLHFQLCATASLALGIASRERVDAMLLGPFDDLDAVPAEQLAELVERGDPPVLLLLRASAWPQVDWDALPCAGVDGVLSWEECRGPRMLEALRYNLARATAARRRRAACIRSENMSAAVASLAAVTTRAELPEVAVDAALALRGQAGALMLVDREDLVLAHARRIPDDDLHVLARCTVGISGHPVAEAARTRLPVWSYDADEMRAALPLAVDDELVGVLWIWVNRATADDHRALESLAEQVAQAIGRVRVTELLLERARSAERLISIAAHDLRSPLQVITMGAGLLRMDDAVTPGKRFLVERINESAERASSLVAELLALAKSKHAQSTRQLVSDDVFTLLHECVQDFQVRMPDCPVSVTTTGSGSAPIDRDHLTQALHNLLANAAHYRDPGTTVGLRGFGATDRVYLEVHNQGPEIPTDKMSALFAPLTRGVEGGERGSLGLGLYIVRSLVEGDGGRVWARSSAAEGTTFVIALPRVAKTARAALPQTELTPFRPRPMELPAAYAALLASLPEGPLTLLLTHWLELGGAHHLPHPQQLDRARLLAHLPDMFWVQVLRDARGTFQFRFAEIGGVLERRLDGCDETDLIGPSSDAAFRPSLRSAYQRCASTRRPAYDYLRSGPGSEREDSFTRLVLPFSRDGESVTHLIGMALFKGFAEASHASAIEPVAVIATASPPCAADTATERTAE